MKTKLRVFLLERDLSVDPDPVYTSIVMSVPRIGETVCVQTDKYLIVDLEWTFIDSKPHADIYCLKQDNN